MRLTQQSQGGRILATLISLPIITAITTITRREPKGEGAKLTPIVESDSSKWTSALSSITPTPQIYFSALGTTKAVAGSIEAQRKIDYDLNLALATAALKAGSKILVLISTNGANATSIIPYSKMKGELEDTVKELGFEHTIILRPGLIVGKREETRAAEGILRSVANVMGGISNALKDFWAQDAEVIAKAGVAAALLAQKGEVKQKVWILNQSDIVRMGRTEWKE